MIVMFGCFNRFNYQHLVQRSQVIADHFAASGGVLYVEFISSRLAKHCFHVLRTRGKPKVQTSGLEFLLPSAFPNSPLSIVRGMSGAAVEREIRRLADDHDAVIGWIEHPSRLACDFCASRRFKTVYDCMGKYQDAGYPVTVRCCDAYLRRAADKVVTDSLLTYRELLTLRMKDDVHYLPQGVRTTLVKADAAETSNDGRPVVGYVGSFHRAFDWSFLLALAESNPDFSFILAGPIKNIPREAQSSPNITLLGEITGEELARTIDAFQVGIIPYVVSTFTDSVYPTKVWEYLARGKPVISTPLPSLLELGDLVSYCGDPRLFRSMCLQLIGENTAEDRLRRLNSARDNSWEGRLAEVDAIVGALRVNRP